MMASELSAFSASPWLLIAWMLLAGFILGLFFFGSLWFVTGRVLRSSRPAIWLLAGFFLRLALVLPALYWLSDAQWQRLLLCMVGFIVARILVIGHTAKRALAESAKPDLEQEEARHAS